MDTHEKTQVLGNRTAAAVGAFRRRHADAGFRGLGTDRRPILPRKLAGRYSLLAHCTFPRPAAGCCRSRSVIQEELSPVSPTPGLSGNRKGSRPGRTSEVRSFIRAQYKNPRFPDI